MTILDIIPQALAAGFMAWLKILAGPWTFYRKMPKEWRWAEPAAYFIIMGMITTLALLPTAFKRFGFDLDIFNTISIVGGFATVCLTLLVIICAFPFSLLYKLLGATDSTPCTTFKSMAFTGSVLPVAAILVYIEKIPLIYRGFVILIYGGFLLCGAAVILHKVRPLISWTTCAVLVAVGIGAGLRYQTKQNLLTRNIDDLQQKLNNEQFNMMKRQVYDAHAKEWLEKLSWQEEANKLKRRSRQQKELLR